MFALSRRRIALASLLALASAASAVGQADNAPDKVRPVPPKGVVVPQADLAELMTGLKDLRAAIDETTKKYGTQHPLTKLQPDVEIYHRAVRFAIENDEFFPTVDPKAKKDQPPTSKDIAAAKKLLATGLQRAKELAEGKPTWLTATGYVVRGYRSKIDGSAQPYAIQVPKDYDPMGMKKHRLDFWWHGRGELLSEVNFLANNQGAQGIIPQPDAFVLLPYGRYCNANKFAGEVDSLEALEHAKANYRIDERRLVARGFSMGGAACWQYATHFPTLWAAAAPGAGFAETPEFLNVFQNEKVEPTWYEKKLWRLYNATDYALNLYNLPTVAYSGEIDKQKQAADVMEREMKKVGLILTHIIGPKTAHSYEKGAKAEVNEKIDAIVAEGKVETPAEIKFVTYTLRYNRCGWIEVTGLEKHWERAYVEAKDNQYPHIKTENVSALNVYFSGPRTSVSLVVDGTKLTLPPPEKGLLSLRKEGGKWSPSLKPKTTLAKTPGLQGPIDDAFYDSFVNILPTGKPLSEATGKWVEAESKHAIDQWKRQFRGDAPTMTDEQFAAANAVPNANLVLWGDPQSNGVLKKMVDKLPVKWTAEGVVFGGTTYPLANHVPVLIFPNPYYAHRYVVLNSGFTFREYDQLNNARQVPKLPDYAIVDVSTPPGSRYPGKIVRAGFFGESWNLLKNDGQ